MIAESSFHALSELYVSTRGENWNNLGNWMAGDPCSWYGVSCDKDGAIVKLALQDNNLVGYLPSELGLLSDVKVMNLKMNPLTGPLPAELGNLQNAKNVMIEDTMLCGDIPLNVAKKALLNEWQIVNGNVKLRSNCDRQKDIRERMLSSQVDDDEVRAWIGLMSLYYQMDGENWCHSLNWGSVTTYPCDGDSSNWYGIECSSGSVTGVNLPLNGLSGSLVEYAEYISEIAATTTLTSFDLSYNSISGRIPSEMGLLTDSSVIKLNDNDIRGSIPSELALLSNTEIVNLKNNNLCGNYPECTAQFFLYLEGWSDCGNDELGDECENTPAPSPWPSLSPTYEFDPTSLPIPQPTVSPTYNPTDGVVVSITAVPTSVTEGDDAEICVSLDNSFHKDVTVEIIPYDNTAEFSGDWYFSDFDPNYPTIASPYDVTIPAGDTKLCFTIDVHNDDVYELTEYVSFQISSVDPSTGVTIGDSVAILTIVDDDDPIVSIVTDTSKADEGATITWTVCLDNGGTGSVSDLLVILSKSGTTDAFDITSGVYPTFVIIPVGETCMTFTVTTITDSIAEGCETIVYTISSVGGVAPTTASGTTSTICDVTAMPTFEPSSSPTTLDPTGSPTSEVTVSISSGDVIAEGEVGYFTLTLSSVWYEDVDVLVIASGTADSDTDYTQFTAVYTIPAGDLTAVIELASQEDSVVEGTEIVFASITSSVKVGNPVGTMSIVDSTATPQLIITSTPTTISEGETGTFLVAIINGVTSTSDIVVSLDSSSSLAESTEFDGDFVSSVTIPAGESSDLFTVVATTDDVFETDKVVTYNILTSTSYEASNPSSASIEIVDVATPTASPIATPTASPTAGVSVAITADTDITEGETGKFYLTLNQEWYTNVIVTIVYSGTAVNGADYNLDESTSFISIPAGDLTKEVQVEAIADSTYEGIEFVVASIAPFTPVTVTQNTAVMSIFDSDDEPTIGIDISGAYSIDEGTGNTIFIVSITNGVVSVNDIIVNVVSSGSVSPNDFEQTIPTEVIISAGQVFGLINMVSIADNVYEGEETITFTIVSGTGYSVGSPTSATHALVDTTPAPTPAPSSSPTACGLGGEGSIALCALYETAAGTNWFNNKNWNTATRPCTGSWYGVTCEENSWGGLNENENGYVVTRLSLNNNNAIGFLPTEMGLLTGLINGFEFVRNTLTKTIPTELGHFSLLVQKFKLSTNHLEGTIPTELGMMTALTLNFGLQENNLHGTIPSTLGQISKLVKVFSLHTNLLTGTVPPELGQLTGLTASFNIGSNYLQGTLPVQLSKLSLIKKDFIVRENSLSGSIPSEFGLFTALTGVFHLNLNALSGSIPSQLGMMTSMVSAFFLHENSLTGSIPSELGKLEVNGQFITASSAFLLRDNSLCGRIPDEVTAMSDAMDDLMGGDASTDNWDILIGNPSVCDPDVDECTDC